MPSIFTKIINGEIPCYKIAENENFIAFLDVFPIAKGHILVVPKTEVDNIFDADENLLQQWLLFAKPIAKAIEKTMPCKRCGISVIGLEVPHAHMHLVPISTANDINFTKEKLQIPTSEMEKIQQTILQQLALQDVQI